MSDLAFQDKIPNNYCWGCGSLNDRGLHIKSHWADGRSICSWQPSPEHMAGPQHILNGGIIATIIDCHCVCSAIAAAYEVENRALGSAPEIWYATASLNIQYLRPTAIDKPVSLQAKITEIGAKKPCLAVSFPRRVSSVPRPNS